MWLVLACGCAVAGLFGCVGCACRVLVWPFTFCRVVVSVCGRMGCAVWGLLCLRGGGGWPGAFVFLVRGGLVLLPPLSRMLGSGLVGGALLHAWVGRVARPVPKNRRPGGAAADITPQGGEQPRRVRTLQTLRGHTGHTQNNETNPHRPNPAGATNTPQADPGCTNRTGHPHHGVREPATTGTTQGTTGTTKTTPKGDRDTPGEQTNTTRQTPKGPPTREARDTHPRNTRGG